jgi:multiple sugar transport system substrate-binding protein
MTPVHPSISRRTFLQGVAATAATTTLLAACGTGPIKSGSGPVTLNFWGGVPAESGPTDLIEAFQKKYPTIKVKYTRFVNDNTGNVKLDTALEGGTPIDLFMSYEIGRMVKRIDSGAALDLGSFIEADNETKQWVTTQSQAIYQYKGKYWGLPIAQGPTYIFVNKNMVEAAGITLPEQWTVNEFREITKKLSQKGIYGTYDTPDLAYAALGPNDVYKDGGKTSNFDHPMFRESFKLHRDMIVEKSAFPWTEVLAQNLRVYSQSIFLKGQVAMASSSDFWHRYITDTKSYPHDFVTTFMPLPKPDGVDNPYTPGGLNNWRQINAQTRNKEAAWTFLRYSLGEGAKYMIRSGRNPAFPGTSADDVVNNLLGSNKEKLYDVEAYKRVVLSNHMRLANPTITTAAAQITQIQQAQTDRYFIGEVSLDQCIQTIKQQSDDAIQKAGA